MQGGVKLCLLPSFLIRAKRQKPPAQSRTCRVTLVRHARGLRKLHSFDQRVGKEEGTCRERSGMQIFTQAPKVSFDVEYQSRESSERAAKLKMRE